MYQVLKPFKYAEDGIRAVDLAEGDELDFGSIAPGLIAEGFISEVKEKAKVIDPVAGEKRPAKTEK